MSEHLDQVKIAVCKLLDIAATSKHKTLAIDTDEECPHVYLWTPPDAIKVSGVPLKGFMYPPQDEDGFGESWSFLECCEKAIELAASVADVKEKTMKNALTYKECRLPRCPGGRGCECCRGDCDCGCVTTCPVYIRHNEAYRPPLRRKEAEGETS